MVSFEPSGRTRLWFEMRASCQVISLASAMRGQVASDRVCQLWGSITGGYRLQPRQRRRLRSFQAARKIALQSPIFFTGHCGLTNAA